MKLNYDYYNPLCTLKSTVSIKNYSEYDNTEIKSAGNLTYPLLLTCRLVTSNLLACFKVSRKKLYYGKILNVENSNLPQEEHENSEDHPR